MTDALGDSPDPTLIFGQQEKAASLPKIPDIALSRMIGKGGMGVVYLGKQAFIDREVAVKVLGPTHRGSEFEARFKREAKILAGISHPNVVGCYSGGTTEEGTCYLVMEFVDGPNLLTWIKEEGNLPPRTALSIVADLARALKHAYESTIIHRDIKPANVLLQRAASDAEGCDFPFRVKLADLGLARATSTTEATLMDLTQPGAVMGSPPTMAPEQFDAPDEVDYRTDIYALGCVLYHALTGKVAYPQTTLSATITQKLSDESPDPRRDMPELDRELGRFVRRLLAKDRTKRPQSYDEIIEVCEALATKLGDRPPAAPQGWARRAAWAGGAVGALLVLWVATRPGETEANREGGDVPIADLEQGPRTDGGHGSRTPSDPNPAREDPDPIDPPLDPEASDPGGKDSEVPPAAAVPPPRILGIDGARDFAPGETVRLTARTSSDPEGGLDGWTWSWKVTGLEEIESRNAPEFEFRAPTGSAGETVTARVTASLDRPGFESVISDAITISIRTPRLDWVLGGIAVPEGPEEGDVLTVAAPLSENRSLRSTVWLRKEGPSALPERHLEGSLVLTLPEAKADYQVEYELIATADDGEKLRRPLSFTVAADDDPTEFEVVEAPTELEWGDAFTVRARVTDPDDDIPSDRLQWVLAGDGDRVCARTDSEGPTASFKLGQPQVAPPTQLTLNLELEDPSGSRVLDTLTLPLPPWAAPPILAPTQLVSLVPDGAGGFSPWERVQSRTAFANPSEKQLERARSMGLKDGDFGLLEKTPAEELRSFTLLGHDQRAWIPYRDKIPSGEWDLQGWFLVQSSRIEEAFAGVGLTFSDGTTLGLRVTTMSVMGPTSAPPLEATLAWARLDPESGRWSPAEDRTPSKLGTWSTVLESCSLEDRRYPVFRFELRDDLIRVRCGVVTDEGPMWSTSEPISIDYSSRPVGLVLFADRANATWGDLEWLPPSDTGD